ncbi:MAG TPA: cyclic nucleotide-binding domain-containing protein [Actinomycetota bacterium]|jgi:CRP-like cAMP-binding protein
MSEADLERLRTIPLFAEVGESHLERIASSATPFEVESGYVLAERGQPGSGMFVILEGTVEVQVPSRDPVPLGPGEFFGELSLLADMDRVARVKATSAVRGLAIGRSEFLELLHEEPAIAVAMVPVLARRLAAVEAARR